VPPKRQATHRFQTEGGHGTGCRMTHLPRDGSGTRPMEAGRFSIGVDTMPPEWDKLRSMFAGWMSAARSPRLYGLPSIHPIESRREV
jgi:hypothetical protein